jgi:putative flippase GtrA
MKKRDIIQAIESLTDLKRGFKFSLTSVVGLGVENLLLLLMVEVLTAPLIAAKLVGAELSIATMFVLNNRFTYEAEPGRLLTRFLKSNIVRAGGVLIATAVLLVLESYGVWYLLANVIGICIGFVFNYGLETVYTWKEHQS